MRRVCLFLLTLLLCLPLPARTEAWFADRELHCEDGLVPCHILQMVMTGRFAALDVTESLNVRVYAAALPRLLALTEADIAHFQAEFQSDPAQTARQLHIAVGYCLWADILVTPQVADGVQQAYREVLLLFLRPAEGAKDLEDQATIRSQLTDSFIVWMAEGAGLTVPFLEHVCYSDDWTDAAP